MDIKMVGTFFVLALCFSSTLVFAEESCGDLSGHYVMIGGDPNSISHTMDLTQTGCSELFTRWDFANGGFATMDWKTDGVTYVVPDSNWTQKSYWQGNTLVYELGYGVGFQRETFELMANNQLLETIDVTPANGATQHFQELYQR